MAKEVSVSSFPYFVNELETLVEKSGVMLGGGNRLSPPEKIMSYNELRRFVKKGGVGNYFYDEPAPITMMKGGGDGGLFNESPAEAALHDAIAMEQNFAPSAAHHPVGSASPVAAAAPSGLPPAVSTSVHGITTTGNVTAIPSAAAAPASAPVAYSIVAPLTPDGVVPSAAPVVAPVAAPAAAPIMKGGKRESAQPYLTKVDCGMARFFQPKSAYKGIIVNCPSHIAKLQAIASASSAWEDEDYTLLWASKRVPQGLKVSSKSRWLKPISHKQLINMLLAKTHIHKELIKRNGARDPLKKTLLIVDDIQELVSAMQGEVLQKFQDVLHKSYERSGAKSVRLLSFTAIRPHPLYMFQALNLLRPGDNALPTAFEDIVRKYLHPQKLQFTHAGRTSFLNDTAGYTAQIVIRM